MYDPVSIIRRTPGLRFPAPDVPPREFTTMDHMLSISWAGGGAIAAVNWADGTKHGKGDNSAASSGIEGRRIA